MTVFRRDGKAGTRPTTWGPVSRSVLQGPPEHQSPHSQENFLSCTPSPLLLSDAPALPQICLPPSCFRIVVFAVSSSCKALLPHLPKMAPYPCSWLCIRRLPSGQSKGVSPLALYPPPCSGFFVAPLTDRSPACSRCSWLGLSPSRR